MAYLPRWVVGRTKYLKMVRFLGKQCLHGKGLLRSSSTAPHCVNRETEAPRDEPARLKATLERAVNSSLFIQVKAQSRAGSELFCASCSTRAAAPNIATPACAPSRARNPISTSCWHILTGARPGSGCLSAGMMLAAVCEVEAQGNGEPFPGPPDMSPQTWLQCLCSQGSS